jgi:hypothetical protein
MDKDETTGFEKSKLTIEKRRHVSRYPRIVVMQDES